MTDSKDIPIGERLTSARKKKRLRYKKLSSELNIEESYLIALEEENYDYIPGGEAYVKGFLRSYSKKLNLDPDEIISQYIDSNYKIHKGKKSNYSYKKFESPTNYPIIFTFIGILLIILIFIALFQEASTDSTEDTTTSEPSEEKKQESEKDTQENSVILKQIQQNSLSLDKIEEKKIIEKKEEKILSSTTTPTINIEVYDDCWVEVFTKKDRLLYKLAKSGDTFNFSVEHIKIIVGNYKNVQVSFNDKIVELGKYANTNQVSCVVLPLGDCSEFRTTNN